MLAMGTLPPGGGAATAFATMLPSSPAVRLPRRQAAVALTPEVDRHQVPGGAAVVAVPPLAATVLFLNGAKQRRRRLHRRSRRVALAASGDENQQAQSEAISAQDEAQSEAVSAQGEAQSEAVSVQDEADLQMAITSHARRCGLDSDAEFALLRSPRHVQEEALRTDFRNSPDSSVALREFLVDQQVRDERRIAALEEPRYGVPNKYKDPRDMVAYLPGEGYGSNVIPFAGISPGKGFRGRQKAEELMKRALEIGETIKSRQRPYEIQEIPIPEEQCDRLQELGWFQAVADMHGCRVGITDEPAVEDQGCRWKTVELLGSKTEVRAGTLHLMSALAPQQAVSNV